MEYSKANLIIVLVVGLVLETNLRNIEDEDQNEDEPGCLK
jgi:hypothetical protein